MVTASHVLFLGCLLTIQQRFSVQSISCAQCNPNDPTCESGSTSPQPCGPRGTSCITYNFYLVGGGRGTMRGCTNETGHGEEECLPQKTRNGRDIVVCVRICNWEGCNSSYGSVLSLLRSQS